MRTATMTEDEALHLLAGPGPIDYDQLECIFLAFGFDVAETGLVTWYEHKGYRIGPFRAEPNYPFSVLSDGQIAVVRSMITKARMHRRAM